MSIDFDTEGFYTRAAHDVVAYRLLNASDFDLRRSRWSGMPNEIRVGPVVNVTNEAGHPVHEFSLAPAESRQWMVTLEGHRAARLDVRQPREAAWGQMLLELLPHQLPVFLECQQDSHDAWSIVDVTVPEVVRVKALSRTAAGEVVASLPPLPSMKTIPRVGPLFDESISALARALTSDAHVVVASQFDDRSISYAALAPANMIPAPTAMDPECLLTEAELLERVTIVERDEAHSLFTHMCKLACSPTHVNHSCTPFAYVVDGCSERAHEICRQLFLRGIVCAKVWLQAEDLLRPESPNMPGCFAEWNFHVAPVVRTRTTIGDEWRVIDPALFDLNERVPTIDEWRARQRDPNATSVITAAGVAEVDPFSLEPSECDPTFKTAQRKLAKYRAKLIKQVQKFGAPPYC